MCESPAIPVRTWLATYAEACDRAARRRLIESAVQFGIDVMCAWTRETLESTAFYHEHHARLDQPRGAADDLWKPFIIRDTLKAMADGERLVYADAGIAIVGSLGPVLALCREGQEVVLFADDDCDRPTVDGSFLIVRKSGPSVAFIDDWLSCACRDELLTDAASVLARLALRHGIEPFPASRELRTRVVRAPRD